MKKTLLVLGITLIGTLLGSNIIGQTGPTATNNISLGMPEVLLVKSSASVNLVLSPQDAGLAVKQRVSDSTARILISSVVKGTESRNLSASITTGAVPAGTILKLVAKSPNSSFVGTAGTFAAEVQLSGTDQHVVTGIGTCYSGIAADDGYVLKYSYGIPESTGDYGSIRASAGVSVTVTLTLSAGV